MRKIVLWFAPLALVACNDSTPADTPSTPQPSGVQATTNATVVPVPTGTVPAGRPTMAEDAPMAGPTMAEDAPMSGNSGSKLADASSSSCGADKAARFVGRDASPAIRREVAQSVGHNRIRWIGPDDAVTMDFSENRLNADLDATGKIKGFRCG